MEVYYSIYETDELEGLGCLTFVEKKFYDKNKNLDEGVEPEYQKIMEALDEVGCPEMMESMCEMSVTEAQMVAAMKDKGFNMIRNDEISS